MNVFWLCAIGIIAAVAGFWSGRMSLLLGSAGEEGLSEIKPESAEVENTMAESIVDRERMPDMDMASSGYDIKEHGTEQVQETELQGQVKSMTLDQKMQNGRRMQQTGALRKESILGRLRLRRSHSNNEKRIPLGWAIGSPAEGAVKTFDHGDVRGAMVRTTKGCLYAPSSGKIVRLYPSGSQMMLRTDFGVELLIRVGSGINGSCQAAQPDEMLGEYFRPRVLQNEIVTKGKLLLEYDREALLAAGADTDIFVGVEEAGDFRDITVTEKTQVKQGEEILWVMDHSRIVKN
ncbi:MAG: PTS glucose transporter subunit IIA [Bacteroidales bacterium]|nr:PTS glucose transporter subunit IIA [Lachnoclostridium sp.]MCM1383292.1 PTS glucose transporter subunit IIA [Lachnoclostridium sp.]MCM1464956.1 PTS glucose transporter subunit IIA [Bacteroidales bacterium]